MVWAQPGNPALARTDVLSPQETGRRAAYHREIDRARFTVGAVLVRLLFAAYLSVADPGSVAVDRTCRCGRPHGRPRVAGSGIAVSITHAGDRVGVACGVMTSLGLDVEPMSGTDIADLRSIVLSPHELTAPELRPELGPHQKPDRGRLLSYWIRKEAVLKATGDGLGTAMSALTVSAPDQRPALLRFDDRPDLPGRTTMVPLNPGGRHCAVLAAVDVPDLTVTEIFLDEHFAGFAREPQA